MSCLKIMGSHSRLEAILERWPEVTPRGGHTLVEYDPAVAETKQMAKALFATLVTEFKFTAIDTTVADKPQRITKLPETEAEVVLIPQLAGG